MRDSHFVVCSYRTSSQVFPMNLKFRGGLGAIFATAFRARSSFSALRSATNMEEARDLAGSVCKNFPETRHAESLCSILLVAHVSNFLRSSGSMYSRLRCTRNIEQPAPTEIPNIPPLSLYFRRVCIFRFDTKVCECPVVW